MSGSAAAATDDVVATPAEAAACGRPPLLVLEPLEAFLDRNELGSGPIEAEQIGEGHSNVTYLLRRADLALVLRRPPRPPLPPSAHDVVREAGLLRALAPTPVAVPAVLATCSSPAVIGAPFYLMEHLQGEVVTSRLPPSLRSPRQRQRAAAQLLEALVEIHAVDWRAAGLGDFGRPGGYLERQLRRFDSLWKENRTRELPALDHVGGWLAAHRPESDSPTIVHGDYRLGNVMLSAATPVELLAVFDWEMATIGDPLADLGYLCALWSESADPSDRLFDLSPVTREAGFPTRAELAALYEERSGRRASDLRWYEVLALWKSAIYMEGNHRRALAGATDDPFLQRAGACVEELAARAEQLACGPSGG
jgi:aminoglycoside phosphotransferase (APT) family kinase protein